jgi:hypothetical protein
LRLWLARLLIGLVIAWNLQAALAFLLSPGANAPGFELSGIPGQAAIRGIAVLFVMWNVPYILAVWQPRKYVISLMEALAMQSLGLAGETGILMSLPPEHLILRGSIERFIVFDAAGLAVLAFALWLVWPTRSKNKTS